MKKITIIAVALAAFALASCVSELDSQSAITKKTYTLSFAPQTKTAVDSEGKVSWSTGDKVRYFSANGEIAKEATVVDSKATFELLGSGFIVAAYGGTDIYDNSETSLTIANAVPQKQDGSFASAHVAVAKVSPASGSSKMEFTNVTSILKFSLNRTDIDDIVISQSDYNQIYGSAVVSLGSSPSASFVENSSNYQIYLRSGGSSTFYVSLLPGNYSSGLSITLYDFDQNEVAGLQTGPIDLKANQILDLGVLDHQITKDLSTAGTANCYIVSEAGKYSFPPVKGNSGTSVGAVASVAVLWESFGTSTSPETGEIIKSVAFENGNIVFRTNNSFKSGNAVVAAKDASGNILWSWHIWCTDTPSGQSYNNGAGTMMDRNLGATSATPGDVGALGLQYQWGRKDPFLGSSSISSSSFAASTGSWSSVASDSSNGTIEYATANPTTFIKENDNNKDWFYSSDSSTDNTRWTSTKSIYDPCPAGWRVPDGGSSGIWATAFGKGDKWTTADNWNSSYYGMNFGSTDKPLGSGSIWYPASGYIDSQNASMSRVGSIAYYWSVSTDGYRAYNLSLSNAGLINPSLTSGRAYSSSVRCQAQ